MVTLRGEVLVFPDAGPSLVVLNKHLHPSVFIISNKVSTSHNPTSFITPKPESFAEVITIGKPFRTVSELPRNEMG